MPYLLHDTTTHSPDQTPPSLGAGQPSRTEPTYLYLGDHSQVDIPYGFRIYRTTHGSEESWNRFISYFEANIKHSLETDEEYRHQLSRVDWTVHTSPDLQDATIEQVRE